ncbi:MAG: CDP-alcohol phosphatidyltransferase family protein [Cyclobacteriaceae bacterium]
MKSLVELKKVCRKDKLDPFWISNVLARPFSIYVTWICIQLGIRANQITFVSCVFALSSSFILLLSTQWALFLSAVFLYVFYILDHVDGELARYYIYKSKNSDSFINLSGIYFDRIVHYFLGITLYPCLGISLYLIDEHFVWLVLGVIGAVGSSGLPRFTSAFTVFEMTVKNESLIKTEYIKQFAGLDFVYWTKSQIPRDFIVLPRNFIELKYVLKQYLSFPGDLIIYIVFVNADVFWGFPDLLFTKIYLTFFASIRLLNIAYSAYNYFNKLRKIPFKSSNEYGKSS